MKKYFVQYFKGYGVVAGPYSAGEVSSIEEAIRMYEKHGPCTIVDELGNPLINIVNPGETVLHWRTEEDKDLKEVASRFLGQKATYGKLRQAVKAAKIADKHQMLTSLLSILPHGMDEGSGE